MRICVLTTTFPSTVRPGDPPFVEHLSRAIADRGHGLVVLTQEIPGAPRVEHDGSLEIRRFSYFRPRRLQRLHGGLMSAVGASKLALLQVPGLLWAMHRALRSALRSERADLVHAHWAFPSGWVAARLGRRLGTPVVVTVHGSDVFTRSSLLRALSRAALRSASVVTANSRATLERVQQIAPGVPGEIIGMPFQLPPSATRAESGRDRLLVLAVGRLIELKGHAKLVAAFADIVGRIPSAKLKIIGDGPERTSLQRQITELGLTGSVELLGALPHNRVLQWISRAAVLVQPSIVDRSGAREALGVTLLEAMALGTPVIATDCGGVRDLVADGSTGLLVAPGSVEQLVAAIDRALRGAVPPAITMRAAEHVRHTYGAARVAERFESVFERALSAFADTDR